MQRPVHFSNVVPVYPTTLAADLRDARTVEVFNAEIRKRNAKDAQTPDVQFFRGMSFVEKRPIDTNVADGKRQTIFYNQTPLYALGASQKSAQAQLLARRPEQGRDFTDELYF